MAGNIILYIKKMAKKFNDLRGVVLKRESDSKIVSYKYHNDKDNYTIISGGDRMYMLDEKDNFNIVELIIKYRVVNYKGIMEIRACKTSDEKEFEDYIPEAYINSDVRVKKLISFSVRRNRTHSGLYFTSIEEAKMYQQRLRKGIGFVFLKPGDIIYLVINSKEIKKVRISDVRPYDEYGQNLFKVFFGKSGRAILNHTRYEEKATCLLDSYFYTFSDELSYKDDIKLYLYKDDAEKDIKEFTKRKQKSATVKYIKEIENHDGKPISFTDKKGKQLHYGDRVAYAVSGGSSAPFISFGVIKGESKTKVSIVDEEKNNKGEDIKHSVYPTSVLLVKEAEFNESSGLSFVKTK